MNYKEYKVYSTLTIKRESNYMPLKQFKGLLHQSENIKLALFPTRQRNQNHEI
jgi:hypothetical protein